MSRKLLALADQLDKEAVELKPEDVGACLDGGADRPGALSDDRIQRRIREIAKALRRHIDAATLQKIVNELLDVPGNRSFRDAIEELARELMRR